MASGKDSSKNHWGKVYLVGAGPGDPMLLTRRAYQLIQSVDIILYDQLISAAILACIPDSIKKEKAGRRAGDATDSMPALHPLVLEHVKQGHDVLRLKCGDPLIFGRGGEEALALNQAGISFELIPGITAASGAAASAQIPLTQRGIASDVTFATAHRASGPLQNLVDWASLPRRGTLVLYMVAAHLEENLNRLIEEGRPQNTPCVFIANATLASEIIIEGTLADLAEKVDSHSSLHAALVIIGEVVGLREKLR